MTFYIFLEFIYLFLNMSKIKNIYLFPPPPQSVPITFHGGPSDCSALGI